MSVSLIPARATLGLPFGLHRSLSASALERGSHEDVLRALDSIPGATIWPEPLLGFDAEDRCDALVLLDGGLVVVADTAANPMTERAAQRADRLALAIESKIGNLVGRLVCIGRAGDRRTWLDDIRVCCLEDLRDGLAVQAAHAEPLPARGVEALLNGQPTGTVTRLLAELDKLSAASPKRYWAGSRVHAKERQTFDVTLLAPGGLYLLRLGPTRGLSQFDLGFLAAQAHRYATRFAGEVTFPVVPVVVSTDEPRLAYERNAGCWQVALSDAATWLAQRDGSVWEPAAVLELAAHSLRG